jgi:ABC-type amino acid transport substrate-binding protein
MTMASIRNTITMTAAWFGLAAALSGPVSPAARADTLADIKARGEINVCNGIVGLRPYLYKNADGSYTGFEYEMMTYTAKKLGIPKISFVQLDWAALIPGLKSGRCDIIWSGMTMTEQRRTEGGVEFSLPYFFEDDHIVVTTDSPIKTLDDLKGKTLGTTVGTVEEIQAKGLVNKGYGANIKAYNDQKTPFLALLNNQVDALVFDVFSFEGQKEITPNIRMLEHVSLPLAADPKWQDAQDKAPYLMGGTGVAVRKDDTTLLAALNDAIKAMDADGTRQAILTKYHAWDESQTMDHMMKR